MALERGELFRQALPHLCDGRAVGKFAAQLGGAGALAERGEQFYRDPIHRRFILRFLSGGHSFSRCAMCPSSGISSFSIASRQAAGEPGSETTILPAAIPANARLKNAADPIC